MQLELCCFTLVVAVANGAPLFNISTSFNQSIDSELSKLNLTCEENFDCGLTNARCSKGECVCESGYSVAVNGQCRPVSPPPPPATADQLPPFIADILQKSPVLPILIVMGVMFACLCLVLQLFSKARFRHTSRSIFANPQTLKVAQAQERRMSQMSQFSNRTPHRSPNTSSRSARSSYGSNIYPPTEYGHTDHRSIHSDCTLPQSNYFHHRN